ncbi:MAG: DUF294 nucleotidyltransferase-like domain-containing protein [Eudoraea sp.]|uniref:DUF294 nucleotidyltransferase-like domain-containing protein n=1 Tax=Eudoraea sp. TaxID=1979955 RepID=UPI003C781ACC
MKNTISSRVADFLKNYPPFNEMHENDLLKLSSQIRILYQEKGSVIFNEGEKAHKDFYVVHKGAVDLRKTETNAIIDLCDEGDIFGLRPLMANEDYKLEAKAFEESILYAIPIDVFKPFTKTYEELGDFLIESFASNTRNPYAQGDYGKLLSSNGGLTHSETRGSSIDLQPIKYSKKIVSCGPNTNAKTVAQLMAKKDVGSVLVIKENLPIGIITDKDLLNTIANSIPADNLKAKDIMMSPVITYPKVLSISQAQMAMMKNDISHLCLTEDGTVNSPVVGVLSTQDIMIALGNSPVALMKAITRSEKIGSLRAVRKNIRVLLKDYLDSNIPMSITSKIISELNDACMKQVIKISLSKLKNPPPVEFAWLALGSQGRGEQLLQTDQDNTLIFQDVSDELLPQTTTYFLELSKLINKGLFKIGYEYCPAEMMASNPKWCLSLSEWKGITSHWIINPGSDEVLQSSIFFDYNLTYGNASLVDELTEHIFDNIRKYPVFYFHLAAGALQNPSPTGFFRRFLLEEDGKYKDLFDLKMRALMPLTDAARVLILSHEIKKINNTAERFEKLAELEPANSELYLSCSYATKALLKFRAKQGIRHADSGRYIPMESLNKEEKVKLKRTFKIIKEIQDVVGFRFKVSNLLR